MICPVCAYQCEPRVLISVTPFEGEKLDYYFCPACEMIFHTTPLPDGYYQGDYRKDTNGAEGVIEEVLNEQTARVKCLMPYILGLHQRVTLRKVLDIGCSTGVLLETIHEAIDAEVIGVEPGHEYAEHARLRGVVVYKSVTQLIDAYDLTTMIHVLEHIPEPVPTLERLAGISQCLLVEVPNVMTNKGACRLVHPLAFNDRSLYNLLTRTGWAVDWIIPFWGIHYNYHRPMYLLALAHSGANDRFTTMWGSIAMGLQ